MIVKEVLEKSEKQKITRNILEALPDWFGVEESREEYIRDSIETPMVAAYEGDKAVGFIKSIIEKIEALYTQGIDLKSFIKNWLLFVLDIKKYVLTRNFDYIMIPDTYRQDLDDYAMKSVEIFIGLQTGLFNLYVCFNI